MMLVLWYGKVTGNTVVTIVTKLSPSLGCTVEVAVIVVSATLTLVVMSLVDVDVVMSSSPQ